MTLKGAIRSAQAAQRRAAREEQRHQREHERQMRAQARLDELEQAQYEVENYEAEVEALTALHQQPFDPWDWNAIKRQAEPTKPAPAPPREPGARAALEAYTPSGTDRLLRRGDKKRAQLSSAIETARREDATEREAARTTHEETLADWREMQRLSVAVLAGQAAAYQEVLANAEVWERIEEFGGAVTFEIPSASVIRAIATIPGEGRIPREAKSLLKSGKLSVKEMAKGAFNELFQDHVCSVALPVGEDVTALVPAQTAIVDIQTELLNTSTGHLAPATILSVVIPRATIEKLNLETLDPSDSMSNFVHQMNFKRTKGFAAVEPLSSDQFTSST